MTTLPLFIFETSITGPSTVLSFTSSLASLSTKICFLRLSPFALMMSLLISGHGPRLATGKAPAILLSMKAKEKKGPCLLERVQVNDLINSQQLF